MHFEESFFTTAFNESTKHQLKVYLFFISSKRKQYKLIEILYILFAGPIRHDSLAGNNLFLKAFKLILQVIESSKADDRVSSNRGLKAYHQQRAHIHYTLYSPRVKDGLDRIGKLGIDYSTLYNQKPDKYGIIKGFIKVWIKTALKFGTRAKFMQSLKILKISICRDAKSSRAKPSSQLVNLPGARPLMKPLGNDTNVALVLSVFVVGSFQFLP